MAKDELMIYELAPLYGLYQLSEAANKMHLAHLPSEAGTPGFVLCGRRLMEGIKPKKNLYTKGEVCAKCRMAYNHDQ